MVISPKKEKKDFLVCLKRSFSGNCLSKRQAGRVLAKSLDRRMYLGSQAMHTGDHLSPICKCSIK